jgi:predicted RNase H-like nuclease (RuvC/YqgF family)
MYAHTHYELRHLNIQEEEDIDGPCSMCQERIEEIVNLNSIIEEQSKEINMLKCEVEKLRYELKHEYELHASTLGRLSSSITTK